MTTQSTRESTTTRKLTDAERIEVQRKVVAEHIAGENSADYEFVRSTFVQHDRSFFDSAAGGLHFDGTGGVAEWYHILGTLLPDLHIEVTHSYDVPGCSLREMTASGTHSADFADVPASGRHVVWEAIALYIFDEEEPDKLIGERAYWDNDALMKRMRGEEAPPLLGLLERGDAGRASIDRASAREERSDPGIDH
jgi:hypothetical protein